MLFRSEEISVAFPVPVTSCLLTRSGVSARVICCQSCAPWGARLPPTLTRGKNRRRHEFDFGDAPVRVEIYSGEETVEVFQHPAWLGARRGFSDRHELYRFDLH
jgi:hypothetical protein